MGDIDLKKSFILFFLFLGILSIVIQVFFTRELLTLVGGNELIIGIIIFWWFGFTGFGSLVKFKIQNTNKLPFLIITSYLLLGCFLLVDFLAIKFVPSLLPFAGELIPFSWTMFLLPMILFPVCFILGLEFRLGTQFFSLKFGPKSCGVTTNRAYLFESLGFVIGGLAYSFLLIHFLDTWLIYLFLICLVVICLSLYFVFLRNQRFKRAVIRLLLLFVIAIIIMPKEFLTDFNHKILEWQYKNQEIIESINSRYGNIVVTKIDEQYNFFVSGYFLGPTENVKETEETAIIPLLSQKQPSKVLIVGDGWNGTVQEISKTSDVKSITYLEIDKVLVDKLQKYLPEVHSIFKHPKVNLIIQDAVTFLKASDSQYDVVIMSQPPPFNFLFSRFYTQEFFRLMKGNLKPGGVFTFGLPGMGENIDDESQQQFLGSIYQTLKKEFRFVKVLPADKMLFLASDKEVGIVEVGEFNFDASFVTPAYIKYLFEAERTRALNKILSESEVPINSDLHPYGFLTYTKFWSQIYSARISQLINAMFNYRIIIVSILSLAIILLLYLISRKNRQTSYLFSSIIFASATLMVLEIIIILLWQVLFGYIYSQIALILALIMAGLALGNFVIVKRGAYTMTLLKKLQKVYLVLIAIFLGLILMPQLLTARLLGFFALVFGFIAGTIFPLTNKLYIEEQKNPALETGKIYGTELVGSGILILFFNLFLIPMFGFGTGLAFLVGLNLMLLISKPPISKTIF